MHCHLRQPVQQSFETFNHEHTHTSHSKIVRRMAELGLATDDLTNFSGPYFTRPPNEQIINLRVELYHIWAGHRLFIGAAEVLLDFRYIAPF